MIESRHSHAGKPVNNSVSSIFNIDGQHDHIVLNLHLFLFFTWANKQRLIIAMGEWHHEVYKATKSSFPSRLTSEPFNRSLSFDNSGEVSKIKFNA